MKRLLYALSACLVFFAGSCTLTENGIHTKTGKTETRAFDVKDFTKVHLDGGITARIVQSDTYSVSVTTDSGLFDYFEVAAKNDALVIRARPGFGVSIAYNCAVTIAMPKIRALNAAGGSVKASLVSFQQPNTDLDIKAGGSSDVDADVIAKNIYADASTYSAITLKGSAENLRCSASAISKIVSYKCRSTNVDATVKGSAVLYVYAEKSLNAHVFSMGSLYYRGKPEKVHKTVHGIGRIYAE
ncbi:MAG: head GIN domain-containing protein [Treponema sp.]